MSNGSASGEQGEAVAPAITDTEPKAVRHRLWRYGFLSLIGVAALGILALRVNVQGIASELGDAQITWVLAAAGMLTIFYLARAARWYLILGRRHPYRLIFWISSLGYLANNAAPGVGELAKPWLLRTKREVP